VLVLAGVVAAVAIRKLQRPARFEGSHMGEADLILALIAGIVTTLLLWHASLIALHLNEWPSGWSPVSRALSHLFGGGQRTHDAERVFVWAHVLIVLGFLAYLPRSKHLHIMTAVINVYFGRTRARGRLEPLRFDEEGPEEDIRMGSGTVSDMTWKQVVDAYSCTECGRCQDACPAWATGKDLSPKLLIMGLRDHLFAEGPLAVAARAAGGQPDSPPLVPGAVTDDVVWDCVTCGACVEACPVLIEHVDKIVGLRRNLVLEESRFPAELAGAFRGMEGQGNPWGQPASTRLDWARGLPFEVPTVAALAAAPGGLDQLEVLYWVGCAAAFDERNRRVARAFATCLHAAGVSFAVLGQEESCTGDPARRMGNDYVFQMLASGNVETLNRYGMGERTIVTACPHCFNTIGNEYGQLGGSFSVVHHSVYLQRLLSEGRLRIGEEGAAAAGSVTFHDSCYMARYNGVVAAPRDVLGAVPGLELREMEKSGKNTFCCGAGGGRMWMEETRGTRINAERTRQALETGAGTVATSCPFCMTMIKDGLADAAAAGSPGTVSARDIAEILAEVVVPEPVDPRRRLPVLQ